MQILQFFPFIFIKHRFYKTQTKNYGFWIKIPDVSHRNPYGHMLYVCIFVNPHVAFFQPTSYFSRDASRNHCYCPLRSFEQGGCLGQLLLAQFLLLNNRSNYLLIMYAFSILNFFSIFVFKFFSFDCNIIRLI